MKTFYFSLLAKCSNPRIEVRRVVSAEANNAEAAERDILLANQLLWTREGWSISLVEIYANQVDAVARRIESGMVPA